MKYAIEMASGGMIYIPSIMTISSRIQVTLRLLPQQLDGITGGIYEARHRYGQTQHDIYTKFHDEWYRDLRIKLHPYLSFLQEIL
jgi:hypothetical protein